MPVCPAVQYKLSKVTGRDELLESLHNVLYRRKGTVRRRVLIFRSGASWARTHH